MFGVDIKDNEVVPWCGFASGLWCKWHVLQVAYIASPCFLHPPGRWDAEEVEKLTIAVASSLERRAQRGVEGGQNQTVDGIEWKWVGEQVGTRSAAMCQMKWCGGIPVKLYDIMKDTLVGLPYAIHILKTLRPYCIILCMHTTASTYTGLKLRRPPC